MEMHFITKSTYIPVYSCFSVMYNYTVMQLSSLQTTSPEDVKFQTSMLIDGI